MTEEKVKEIYIALTNDFSRKGFTLEDVGERIGYTPSAISMQIRRPFSQKIARKYADAFGYNLTFLLTGEGSLYAAQPQQPAPADTAGSLVLPERAVTMFRDMAQTIRAQQENIAQLSRLVERLADTQQGESKKSAI